MTEKLLSIEEFLIGKIKAVPRFDLFWSECFSKAGVYEPILISFVINGCKTKKVLHDSIQMLIEKGLPYLFKDHEIYYLKLPFVHPTPAPHYLLKPRTIEFYGQDMV